MANGYPPPDESADPAAPAEPIEPASNNEGAAPAKMSQQEANYRESDKVRCCGLCPHWHDCENNWGNCDLVEGEISCFGLCDLYERGDNPFRQGETGEFTGGRRVVVAAVPAPAAPVAAMGRMTAPTPGRLTRGLRIGGKTY